MNWGNYLISASSLPSLRKSRDISDPAEFCNICLIQGQLLPSYEKLEEFAPLNGVNLILLEPFFEGKLPIQCKSELLRLINFNVIDDDKKAHVC